LLISKQKGGASPVWRKEGIYLCHMQIRTATTADVPLLTVFVNSAYRGESSKKGWTTEADLLDGIRTSEASLIKMIQNPAAVILLAEENGEIFGCVYLEQKLKVLYLGMLTVKPELQGKGIGALLMQKAEDRAHQLGCNKIQMTVITLRDSLIAFYQRRGFYDTGERLPFPDDPAFGIPKQPLRFLVMEKRLQHNRDSAA
jgi:predicted N-acetyltransferase YhbS